MMPRTRLSEAQHVELQHTRAHLRQFVDESCKIITGLQLHLLDPVALLLHCTPDAYSREAVVAVRSFPSDHSESF